MLNTAATSGRKPRRAGAPTPASPISINSDEANYNLDCHRAQRLIALAGVSPSFASVMAPFVFGGAA